MLEKLRSLSEAVAECRLRREKAELDIGKQMSSVEKNCLKLLESNRRDRIEVEKRISYQLNSQLDLLSA